MPFASLPISAFQFQRAYLIFTCQRCRLRREHPGSPGDTFRNFPECCLLSMVVTFIGQHSLMSTLVMHKPSPQLPIHRMRNMLSHARMTALSVCGTPLQL